MNTRSGQRSAAAPATLITIPLEILLHALRWLCFVVLGALEPLVRYTLAGVALGGLAVSGFYGLVAPSGLRVPHATLLVLSAASATALVLYGILLRALKPR